MKQPWQRMSLVALCALGMLVACGGEVRDTGTTAAPLTSAEVLQPGGFAVGVTTATFVDASRPTMANGSYPGAPTRTLVTEIWYPTDVAPSAGDNETRDVPLTSGRAPYPLVIYSHGFLSTRTGGAYLARHLASHGYIVASPDFPLTNSGAPGGPNVLDVAQQPGDVSFVIDQVLAGAEFGGAVDRQRIGITGLSLGAMTTSLAAFDSVVRDPRVRAAAPIAGPGCLFTHAFYSGRQIPLLILQGDIDAIVPYQENAVFAFGQADPPKYLVTITGGTHTAFTDGAEFFDGVNNPDDIGCRALTGTLNGQDFDQSFLDRLGGTAAGVIMGDCPAPCAQPGPRPRSIRPSRQLQLTLLSVFPFFESTLRGDARARQFLNDVLPAENPDIRVQHAP